MIEFNDIKEVCKFIQNFEGNLRIKRNEIYFNDERVAVYHKEIIN